MSVRMKKEEEAIRIVRSFATCDFAQRPKSRIFYGQQQVNPYISN